MPSINCFLWIYLPLILAAVIAVLTSEVVNIGLKAALKKQDIDVRDEVREPWDDKREMIKEEK